MPMKQVITPPVRKLIPRGQRFEKSLAGETTFAATLTARVATTTENIATPTTRGSLHLPISFTGSQTGNGFADFLFGRLNNGGVDVQNAMVATRAWSYAVFVQDDIKMTPHLTLNLGVRWQYDQSFREQHNGLAFFNPYTAEWEQFGVNAPETAFDPSRKQFGPRVGVAWSPTTTVVVRGGYGMTYPSAVGHGRAGDAQPGPAPRPPAPP